MKNVIFDIGNVLMEYRWSLPFVDYGLSVEEARRLSRRILDDTWHKLDLGVIYQEEAKEEYRMKYPEDAEAIAYFIDHMDIIRVDRPAVWAKLPELKAKGYRLYYLSNYPKELFAAHMAGVPFFEWMDGGVVSCEVHLCKPDAAIYQYLLDRYGLKPEESLFFDDRAENTQGAEKLGIRSVQIVSQEHLLSELEKL